MIFAVGIHIVPSVVLNFLFQLCVQGKVTDSLGCLDKNGHMITPK